MREEEVYGSGGGGDGVSEGGRCVEVEGEVMG